MASDYSIVDRYETLKFDRDNPMENWNAGPPTIPKAFEDNHGYLGDGEISRLSTAPEQSWTIFPRESRISIDFARWARIMMRSTLPSYDDSALEDEELRQYIEEEREMHKA